MAVFIHICFIYKYICIYVYMYIYIPEMRGKTEKLSKIIRWDALSVNWNVRVTQR